MTFLLTGRVPAPARSVDVRIVEMIAVNGVFGDDPDRVRSFASDVRGYLDSTLTAGYRLSPDGMSRLQIGRAHV